MNTSNFMVASSKHNYFIHSTNSIPCQIKTYASCLDYRKSINNNPLSTPELNRWERGARVKKMHLNASFIFLIKLFGEGGLTLCPSEFSSNPPEYNYSPQNLMSLLWPQSQAYITSSQEDHCQRLTSSAPSPLLTNWITHASRV